MKVLAGDIGGTNTRLALFEVTDGASSRPETLAEHVYPSGEHASLEEIVRRFLQETGDPAGSRGRGGACERAAFMELR